MAFSRNTKIFGVTSFLVDVSSEMVIWILPFFLTVVLGAPVFVVGLVDAVHEVTGKIIGIFSGVYSDKTGKRKNMVIFGYSLSALIKLFLVIATNWWQVLGVVFFERFGKGIRNAPRDALIVMSEKKENLGRAFGFRSTLDTVGAIVGPLIAMFILFLLLKDGSTKSSVENVYRFIFAVSLIPAVIAVFILFFIKEEGATPQDGKRIFDDILKTKDYKRFLLASVIFAIGQFTIAMFLLRAGQFANIIFIPLFGMVFNIVYALFSLPAGNLTDKFGARKALFISWIIFAIGTFGFAIFTSLQAIFIFFAILGLFTAIYSVAPSVYLSKVIPKEKYASATGLYQGIVGLAVLPANFIASMLWNINIFGMPATFVFPILTTIMAIVVLNFLVKE